MPSDNNANSFASGETQISNHNIENLASFEDVTREPRQVAGIYFYMVLDCLVDLAYKISRDFFKRPHLYTQLDNVVIRSTELRLSEILARLHARYGSNERIPSKEQRTEIYVPIFDGAEDYSAADKGDFPCLRDQLLIAAARFAERVFDDGVEMLREAVRDAHKPLKEYLSGRQGDSLRWSKEGALADLTENVSYTVLRSRGVAAIFGIAEPSPATWPYFRNANANKFVEEVSKQLKWSDENDKQLSQGYFLDLQRVALRGAEALATIIDFDETASNDADLTLLITKCYTWGSALQSIGVNWRESATKVTPLTQRGGVLAVSASKSAPYRAR
jgi:hypothetical protein